VIWYSFFIKKFSLKIMANKICERCKKSLQKADFEKQRTHCRQCVLAERNITKSSSPYKYLKNLWSHLKYSREKEEAMRFEITPEQLDELWDKQGGRCALSGVFMTWHKGGEKRNTNVSIDRIDPNIEYILTNIQLVCWRVNLIKHTMSEDELYWWCKNIVTHKENF
jgi:hypothetical protein